MAITTELAFVEGATLHIDGVEAARVRGRYREYVIPRPSPALRSALEALARGAEEAALADIAGADALMLFYTLERLAGSGLLRWTLTCDGSALATLAPLSPYFVRRPETIDEERAYRLSRFVYFRARALPDGPDALDPQSPSRAALRLESSLSHAAVTVHDRSVAALLFDMTCPVSARELASRTPGIDRDAVRAVVQLLFDAAMLDPALSGAEASAPDDVALHQWEFHDLLLHTHSRGNRHAVRAGGTYRFNGKIPPLPAVKPPMSEAFMELFQPDIAHLRRNDLPFTEILERRRTIRSADRARLTAQELGEFLFRCARVREVRASPAGETSDRPYPGAGALYELEIYPAVNACEGIAPGLYHYCPRRHGLEPVSGVTPELGALLDDARSSQPPEDRPDVLLVIAARFPRISFKYEAIAYSLVLKDVGVLLQTMYLVATAMSLAPYALGHGDADVFCRAAGTDYYAESSVGEFALCGAAAAQQQQTPPQQRVSD
jgi:SagB-type dehydrogenase family enzyme